MSSPTTMTSTLALTGASGMAYGLRLLECLLAAGANVYLLYSQAAHIVAKQELDLTLPARAPDAERQFTIRYGAKPGQLRVFGKEDWFAPVASGSNPADAMVICPCSMGTLAAVAAGLADKCMVQISYAIGVAKPTSMMVDTFGTGTTSDAAILAAVQKVFSFKPADIISQLNLLRPIYLKTTNYGHFGKSDPDLTWEATDKAAALKKAIG